jgi:hypothetical protein
MASLGRVVLLFSIASALGCVSTSFTASKGPDGAPLPRVAPESVKVLAAPPAAAFRNVGEINADISGFPSAETVLKHVRERAASVGADAVIYAGAGHAFMANYGFLSDTARTTTITFTAIRLAD